MDILIPNLELPLEERIQLSIYPNGLVVNHSTLDANNRRKAVALPEHGDLVEISKVKEALCIHGQASPWERYVPVIVEASNGTDN